MGASLCTFTIWYHTVCWSFSKIQSETHSHVITNSSRPINLILNWFVFILLLLNLMRAHIVSFFTSCHDRLAVRSRWVDYTSWVFKSNYFALLYIQSQTFSLFSLVNQCAIEQMDFDQTIRIDPKASTECSIGECRCTKVKMYKNGHFLNYKSIKYNFIFITNHHQKLFW